MQPFATESYDRNPIVWRNPKSPDTPELDFQLHLLADCQDCRLVDWANRGWAQSLRKTTEKKQ